MAKPSRLIALTAVLALGAACTVHQASTASPSGPSTLALSITVTATPDRITQDGASQSAIQVQAIGPYGRPQSGVSLRMDMFVGGQFVDFGTLTARTIVTGSDGKASTTYTAPPPPPANQNSGTNTVTLRASAIGTDALASSADYASADITLVPPGVILPPAGTPTAAFTIAPSTVSANVNATFDGSTSSPGTNATQITSYAWNFADGTTGSGAVVTHAYSAAGTYPVTLTVTNDRGLSASSTNNVVVTNPAPPTGDWTNSPVSPVVGDNVIFNADKVQPAPGRTIVQYNWSFGDGTPGASGFVVSHKFTAANTYVVTLSVIDDSGGKVVISHNVAVGTGNPVPTFTVSPTSPASGSPANFDASGTQFFGGATGVTYTWQWGDGLPAGSGVRPSHTYATKGTYTVTLTVTDSQGRTGVSSGTVTVS